MTQKETCLKVLFKNLPDGVKTKTLRKYFETYGEIKELVVKSTGDRGSVEFFEGARVNDLLEAGMEVKGQIVTLKRRKFVPTIILSPISSHVTEEELRASLERYGEVKNVSWPMGDSRSSQHCLVTFRSKASVKSVLQDGEICVQGKQIGVALCEDDSKVLCTEKSTKMHDEQTCNVEARERTAPNE